MAPTTPKREPEMQDAPPCQLLVIPHHKRGSFIQQYPVPLKLKSVNSYDVMS